MAGEIKPERESDTMSRIKRLYICLLAGWLVICAARVLLLPHLGDYYHVRMEEEYNICTCMDTKTSEAHGQMPAALFAELNARMEAAQPGTRFSIPLARQCGTPGRGCCAPPRAAGNLRYLLQQSRCSSSGKRKPGTGIDADMLA